MATDADHKKYFVISFISSVMGEIVTASDGMVSFAERDSTGRLAHQDESQSVFVTWKDGKLKVQIADDVSVLAPKTMYLIRGFCEFNKIETE